MPTFQTIHINDHLQHQILRQVEALFRKRLAEPAEAASKLGDKFYDLLVPLDHRAALAAVPACYLEMSTAISVSVKHTSPPRPSVSMSFSVDKVIPHTVDHSTHGVEKNWREYTITDKVRYSEIITALDSFYETTQTIESELKDMQQRVRKVLSQYKTLRQLLKDHPSLWELIPPDIQRKYSTPIASAPRKAKDSTVVEPKVEVDLTDLQVVLATNKLLGG